MKLKDMLPEHGEIGHFCHGGCAGYARGGSVNFPMNTPLASAPGGGGSSGGKINTTDILAALGALGVAIPAVRMAFGKGGKPATPAAMDVRDTLGNLNHAPDAMGMASGGIVPGEEEKDPAHIPEEIKEFVKKAHKEKNESRPDENWRITPPKKAESIAPYKKDEEEMEASADEEMPAMAAGGVVPGYDEGGDIPDVGDPNALLATIAPEGTGTMVPSPDPAPVQAPQPPISAVAPAPQPMPATPALVKPIAPPASTDQDFMTKANAMLGLDPQKQATFLKMLGDTAQKSQIGAGIAGIGDAIASGGTLGKVNPGNLGKSEDLIQGKTKQGIEGEELIAGGREKAFEAAQKLEAQDPNSPLSKYAQKAYGSVGKKLGLDLSHASASLIADVAGKGVDVLNTEYQGQLKQLGLQLQKEQVEATKANQIAERAQAASAQRANANKDLASQGIIRKGLNAITPSGRAAQTELEKEAGATPAGPVSVNSKAEYDALPSGTHYVDSYGKEKVKA